MKWGDKQDLFDGWLQQTGSPHPELVNRPQLWPENEEYLYAFMELAETRPAGMGPTAISYSEIMAYLALFPVDDVETFCRRIRGADRAVMAWQRDVRERKEVAQQRGGRHG